jgi:hypothetical protein
VSSYPALRVEQSLHGYRDGHELLASSCELPPEARRAMLVLSDLSGEDLVKGFRRYLTGYPVPGTQLYAVACTWYATEMKRPGCVWTHSLLFLRDALSAPQLRSVLDESFRRPSGPKDLAAYTNRLEVGDGGPLPTKRLPDVSIGLAQEILQALYGEHSRPIVLLAEDSRRFEGLVLAIWERQWSSLKSTFAFSTGSLDFRTLGDASFDLQIVPERHSKRIARSDRNAVIFYDDDTKTSQELSRDAPAWTRLVVAGLCSDDSRLEAFMSEFADDVAPTRQSFCSLAEILAAIDDMRREQFRLRALVDLIGDRFPRAFIGAHLKTTILGKGEERARSLLGEIGETERIKAILQTPLVEALPLNALNVEERVAQCFRPSPGWQFERLKWLVYADDLNSEGLAQRARLLSTLTEGELVQIFAEDSRLAREIVGWDRTRLAREPTWNQPRQFQQMCLELLTDSAPEERRAAVSSMVDAAGFAIADEATAVLGEGCLDQVLDEQNARLLRGQRVALGPWGQPLARFPWIAREWLDRLNSALDGHLLRALIASSPGLLAGVRSTHIARALEGETSRGAYHEAGAAGLALAVAFRADADECALIASRCFEAAHDAVLRNALPWPAWGALQPFLPKAGFLGLFDWDGAEKLRRVYADRFAMQGGWPSSLFWEGLTNPDSRRRVTVYCERAGYWRLLNSALGDNR